MTAAQYYPVFGAIRKAFALNRIGIRKSALRKMYDKELTDPPRNALRDARRDAANAYKDALLKDRLLYDGADEKTFMAAIAKLKAAYHRKYPDMPPDKLDRMVDEAWGNIRNKLEGRATWATANLNNAIDEASKPIDTRYREKDPDLRSAQENLAYHKDIALQRRVKIAQYRADAIKELENARKALMAGEPDKSKEAIARAKTYAQLGLEERKNYDTAYKPAVRHAKEQYRQAANRPYTAIPKEQNRKRADALARERFLPWQQGQEGSLRYDALAEQVDRAREKLRDYLIKGNLPTDYNLRRKVFQYYPDFKHPDNPFFEEFISSGMTPTEFVAKRLMKRQIHHSEKPLRHMSEPTSWPKDSDAFSGESLNNPPITQVSYTPEQLDAMTPVQREEAEAYMRRTAPEMQEKHNEARAEQSKDSANGLMEGMIPSQTSQTDVSAQEFPDQSPGFADIGEISDFIEDYFDQDHDEEYDQHQLELKLNSPPPERINSSENYAGKLKYESKGKNPYDTVNENMRAAGTPQPGYYTDMADARKSLLEQVSRKKKAVAQYAKASEAQKTKLRAEIADCDHKIRELSREAHMRLGENTPARNTRRKVPVRNDEGITVRYDTEPVPSGEPVPPTAPLTAEEEKFLGTMDEAKAKNEARPWDPKKPVPKDSWDDKMGRGPGGYVGDAAVPDLTEDQEKKLKSGELKPAKELREQKAKYEEEQKAKSREPPKDEAKKGGKS